MSTADTAASTTTAAKADTKTAASEAKKPASKPAGKPAATKTTPAAKKPVSLEPEEGEGESDVTAGNPPADDVGANVIENALSRVGTSAAAQDDVDPEVTNITLPPNFAFVENVPNSFNGNVFEVQLYGEGCTECKHLVPSAAEGQTNCHFSNGNPYCPAAYSRLTFVGERMQFVSRLRRAQTAGDSNRVLRLLAQLEDQPLETKEFVLREVGLLK